MHQKKKSQLYATVIIYFVFQYIIFFFPFFFHNGSAIQDGRIYIYHSLLVTHRFVLFIIISPLTFNYIYLQINKWWSIIIYMEWSSWCDVFDCFYYLYYIVFFFFSFFPFPLRSGQIHQKHVDCMVLSLFIYFPLLF